MQNKLNVFIRLKPEIKSKYKKSLTPTKNKTNDNLNKKYTKYAVNSNNNILLTEKFDSNDENKILFYKEYNFKKIFDRRSRNSDLYKDIIKIKFEEIINGKPLTFITFGISGSGKTHSIFGPKNNLENGILFITFEDILNYFEENNIKFEINCFFLEIYNENIIDLFNNNSKVLNLKENEIGGISIPGINFEKIKNLNDIKKILILAKNKRHINSNNANIESSRSHVIVDFTINYIKDNKENFTKLCFIDLAGNEKFNFQNKDKYYEGLNINKSLFSLTNCLLKLTNSNIEYIPYRNSKLTRLLKPYFEGNGILNLISCISLEDKYFDKNINTLNYSEKALKIKKKKNNINNNLEKKLNMGMIGKEQFQNLKIEELKNEIIKLKNLLYSSNRNIVIEKENKNKNMEKLKKEINNQNGKIYKLNQEIYDLKKNYKNIINKKNKEINELAKAIRNINIINDNNINIKNKSLEDYIDDIKSKFIINKNTNQNFISFNINKLLNEFN